MECLESARRWQRRLANQDYRRSDSGKLRRKEQAQRYRRNVKERKALESSQDPDKSASTTQSDQPREGYAKETAHEKSCCHRPGCYQRFTALGEVAVKFLDGLLAKTRYSKHHAQKVLTLLNVYPKSDVLAAMERAALYRAFGYDSLERILAHQGTPKPSWQQLSDSEREAIARFTDSKPIPPRHSQEYQDLLYGKPEDSSETSPESPQNESKEDNQEPQSSGDNPQEPGDAQDQDGSRGS